MRTFSDAHGKEWRAVAVDMVGAHGRPGTQLGFVEEGAGERDPVLTPISFNSLEAAELALGMMSEKELLRRLSLAQPSYQG